MKKISYTDNYQKKYHYVQSEPVGKNFNPEFKPELTPQEMLEIGVFGGLYFSDMPSDLPRADGQRQFMQAFGRLAVW